ncbi:MAG: acetylornithine/succinylornithine family transaminase [bacterium]
MTDSLMTTYKPLPVEFESGEGVWLKDSEGKTYLDAISGIAVCSLGHCHPAVTQTLCEQAGKLVHTSNLYQIGNQQRLGDRLTAISGMDRVFFANSGAEANEAAIKLARLYGNNQGIEKPAIIVADNSFHGRTMATLSATGNRKVQAGFEPLVQGFVRVPYGDIEAIRNVAANKKNVVAVMVEPVQGEGGVNLPPEGYLSEIRTLCDEQNWLMILDEIQTGMCRTGEWFGFQHENAVPDIMTLAKALGNGMPIGACLAHGKASDLFAPGNHGSTFGGNPLACAVALTVIDTLESSNCRTNATTRGQQLQEGFTNALADIDGISEIRHQGLMVGIQLDRPCGELVVQALAAGLLINVTADNVIRLLPPLTITEQEANQLIETLSPLIKDFIS